MAWKSLAELSADYEAAASLLRARLRELRQELAKTEDPDSIWHIQRRTAELTPLLTQMNDLAELTAHYYERGGVIDDRYGFNGTRRSRSRTQPSPQAEADESAGRDHRKRIDQPAEGDVAALLSRWSQYAADCRAAESQQEHSEPGVGRRRQKGRSHKKISTDDDVKE